MKKLWLITIIAAGGFFAITEITGAVNANNLYPNTYFNDAKVGGRSVAELENEMDLDFEVTVKAGEDEALINMNDIGYSAHYASNLQDIKKSQNPFFYIFNLSGKKNYDIDINTTYDEDKLKNEISKLPFIDTDNKPQNAYLSLMNNHFEIVKEEDGNSYSSDRAYTIISDYLSKGIISNFDSIDISDAKEKPSITSDNKELNDNLSRLNALASNSLTIDVEGVFEKIEKVGEYLTYKDNKPAINEEKITDYLNTLANKYNTLESKRKFQTTDKGKIEVGGSGIDTYGFKLNIEESIPIIEAAILENNSESIKLVWEYPANTRNAKNGDIGDTYVEIDISRQHMWYYVDGELFVDTDVRTGTESFAQWTPTTEGVFRVLWKQRDKWFTQVEPVCHSDYWMPFNYRGEGIHDATWYSTYGGNYYKWSGSHGCINTPYSVVEKMFEKMEVDTPVVIYRS